MNTPEALLQKIINLLGPNQICVGFETLTVSAVTASQLASVPNTASGAIIQVQSDVTTDAIRYREDGTAPTSTVGKFKSNADEFELIGAQSLKQFKVIQGTGGTTQLNISYYK